jgi:hypothetical protein
MSILTKLGVVIGFAGLSVGPCLADLSPMPVGTNTSVTSFVALTDPNFDALGTFPTSVLAETITSSLSSLAFTYIPPPDYSTGDRVILEVKNGTASTWNNIVFTLSGASDPQYYDVCTSGCAQNNPPYPGVPSEGTYDSTLNTYTTSLALNPDVDSIHTVLSVPLTLAPGATQDFYFAVNYAGTPGDFTLTQVATPEPELYGVLAIGLTGLMVVFGRRRRA